MDPISQELIAISHSEAVSHLESARRQLEQHIKSDYEAVKAKLEARVQHFEVLVTHWRNHLSLRALEHIDEGKDAVAAVRAVIANTPTLAEQAAEQAAAQAAATEKLT